MSSNQTQSGRQFVSADNVLSLPSESGHPVLEILGSDTRGRTLILLARHPDRSWMQQEIAAKLDVSQAQVSKVCSRLMDAGLIERISQTGGVRLVRSPIVSSIITLVEVADNEYMSGY